MPKQTFFNLPDDKREQIVQIAMDEFAENDYDNVSISRIVARAGIAKGSFYQYFEGKEDLYSHLIGLIGETKTRYLGLDHPDPQHVGIFAYMRWLAEVGLGFELAYPKLTRVGVRMLNAGGFPTAIDAQIHEATMAYYRRLVEVGQAQGDIAPDLDPGLAAVIFEGVLDNVGRYIVERVTRDGIADEQTFMSDPQVQVLFARAMDVLEHGMSARTPRATVGPGERDQSMETES